jgi:hypothetical protein
MVLLLVFTLCEVCELGAKIVKLPSDSLHARLLPQAGTFQSLIQFRLAIGERRRPLLIRAGGCENEEGLSGSVAPGNSREAWAVCP